MQPVDARLHDLSVEQGRAVMDLWDQIKQYDDSIKIETDRHVRGKLVEYREELVAKMAAIVYAGEQGGTRG